MKCVMNVVSEKITRVSDKVAMRMVSEGQYKYASKEAWKKGGRK